MVYLNGYGHMTTYYEYSSPVQESYSLPQYVAGPDSSPAFKLLMLAERAWREDNDGSIRLIKSRMHFIDNNPLVDYKSIKEFRWIKLRAIYINDIH